MSIRVTCPNGHNLKVNDRMAGKSGRCPTCRAVVHVPQVEAAPAPAPSESPIDEPQAATPAVAASVEPAPVEPAPVAPSPVQAPPTEAEVEILASGAKARVIGAWKVVGDEPPSVVLPEDNQPPHDEVLAADLPLSPPVEIRIAGEPTAEESWAPPIDVSPPEQFEDQDLSTVGPVALSEALPSATQQDFAVALSEQDSGIGPLSAPLAIEQLPPEPPAPFVPALPAHKPRVDRLAPFYPAIALAAAALISLLPALGHLYLPSAPTWARGLVVLAIIELAYASWMTLTRDRSALWVGTVVAATVATLYALVMTMSFMTRATADVPLGLTDVRRIAPFWCAWMMLLTAATAYYCGHQAQRGRR